MADQYAFDGDHIPTSSSTEQRHFIARECVEMNCNWGIAGVTGKAGACWQCHHAEPCCGEPCNAAQCCYCCRWIRTRRTMQGNAPSLTNTIFSSLEREQAFVYHVVRHA